MTAQNAQEGTRAIQGNLHVPESRGIRFGEAGGHGERGESDASAVL